MVPLFVDIDTLRKGSEENHLEKSLAFSDIDCVAKRNAIEKIYAAYKVMHNILSINEKNVKIVYLHCELCLHTTI